jgi:hypothetical protein
MEGFYNGNYKNMDLGSFTNYYFRPLTVKTLSLSEFSWFSSLSYPIHPLLEGSLSGMLLPDIDGFFINPSLSYSLTDNIRISAIMQHFEGKFGLPEKEKINFVFFRFKWSF